MDYAIIATALYIAIIAFMNAPKKKIATESESAPINYFPEIKVMVDPDSHEYAELGDTRFDHYQEVSDYNWEEEMMCQFSQEDVFNEIPCPWETEVEVVITTTEVVTQPTIAVNAIALLAPATVQCSEPELKEDKLMYSLMTAAKLKQIARKQKVKGYGSMSKRQLIAAIA